MIVKTKNYKLDKKTYINLSLKSVLLKQGWIAGLGALAICLCFFWILCFFLLVRFITQWL